MKARAKSFHAVIPKLGLAPMLLLEWIHEVVPHKNGVISQVMHNKTSTLEIRFYGLTKEQIKECVGYINANI